MFAAAAGTARIVDVNVVVFAVDRLFNKGFRYFEAVDDDGVVFFLECWGIGYLNTRENEIERGRSRERQQV